MPVPDPRPLSEITAAIENGLDECVSATGCGNCRVCRAEAALAELLGRLDGAVVLTREEAEEVRDHPGIAAGKMRGRLALCGRPGKETE